MESGTEPNKTVPDPVHGSSLDRATRPTAALAAAAFAAAVSAAALAPSVTSFIPAAAIFAFSRASVGLMNLRRGELGWFE